ncbi:MAG: hypothetical protein QM736_02000 [Vicinamibacterales bacterium]
MLDVFKTADTVLPLTVLVEENKHASMGDRDGDGIYMPRYDINRYANDGWGTRDTAGTGTLGNPAYTADQSRTLRALRPDLRVFPAHLPPRLRDALARNEQAGVARAQIDSPRREYVLMPSASSAVCVDGHVDRSRIADIRGSKLPELLEHGGFCDRTVVKPAWNLDVQRASDVLATFFPGPRNQFGFMSWTYRMSPAFRWDQGPGASYVGPPLPGHEMPIFGGWIVGKANVALASRSALRSASIEAMYTPSASRSASMYIAIGHEWDFTDAHGRRGVHQDAGRHERDRTDGHVAEEVGLKFRFLVEKGPVKTFLGGRIGLRAAGTNPLTQTRLVFEFGSGSW